VRQEGAIWLSGPKSGEYHVVSAAELRRRRIAAAKDRYSRVLATVQELQSALSAARATYGDLPVSVPQVTVSHAGEAEDWDRASDTLSAGLGTAQRQLEETVRAARLRMLSAEGSRVSSVLVEEHRTPRSAKSAVTESAASDAMLTSVVGRLPAGAPADIVGRCKALVRGFRESSSQSEKAQVLDGIRHLVQVEQDRQARITRNSAIIDELYRELDGLSNDTVDTLRGVLKGLDRASALPDGLHGRVAAAKAAAEAERDREFALATAAKALAELGYALGEDFRTAVPSSGALVELPHSSRHGLRIRERNQRLMLNVVRFDQDGRRDPLADKDAEESFCRDFAQLKKKMHEEGVDLHMLRADAPGQTPIQVLQDESQVRRSARYANAPIKRERSS
jgi:hypothetical protein